MGKIIFALLIAVSVGGWPLRNSFDTEPSTVALLGLFLIGLATFVHRFFPVRIVSAQVQQDEKTTLLAETQRFDVGNIPATGPNISEHVTPDS